jgi:hypothetical protein
MEERQGSGKGVLEAILDTLKRSPLVRDLQVEERDELPTGAFLLKARCRLRRDYRFQVWVRHSQELTRYAYQLFTDHPILRWDNAPHHPELAENYPHHFHGKRGVMISSNLTGDPLRDLKQVLQEIEKHINRG